MFPRCHKVGAVVVAFVIAFLQSFIAVKLFTDNTVPSNLAIECTNALLTDVKCSPAVASLRSGSYYSNTTLEKVCTAECSNSLATYQSNVLGACETEQYEYYEDTPLPILLIPDLLRYHFNLTCMTNAGRFCNNVAAAYAL